MFRPHPDTIRARDSRVHDEDAGAAPALPKRGPKLRGVLSNLLSRRNQPDSTYGSGLHVRSKVPFMASEPDLSAYRSVLPDSVSVYETLRGDPRSAMDQTEVKRPIESTDADPYDFLDEPSDDSGDEPWIPPPDYDDTLSPASTVHVDRAAVPMSARVHDLRGVARNPSESGHAGKELYLTPLNLLP